MSRKAHQNSPVRNAFIIRLLEGTLVFTVVLALFLFLSFVTYHQSDPSWSHWIENNRHVLNVGGRVGAWIADIVMYTIGYLAYLLPVMIVHAVFNVYLHRYSTLPKKTTVSVFMMKFTGCLVILMAASALLDLHCSTSPAQLPYKAGGILGEVVGHEMALFFSLIGSSILLVGLLLVGVTLYTGLSWFALTERIGSAAYAFFTKPFQPSQASQKGKAVFKKWAKNQLLVGIGGLGAAAGIGFKKMVRRLLGYCKILIKKVTKSTFENGAFSINSLNPRRKQEPVIHLRDSSAHTTSESSLELRETPAPVQGVQASIAFDAGHTSTSSKDPSSGTSTRVRPPIFSGRIKSGALLPKMNLLDMPPPSKEQHFSKAHLEQRSREVESRLSDFHVAATVTAVYPGPVVTRFELQLAAGTKVSKISGLAKDLARSLSVISVRVVEVIPGKSVIGLELPNPHREIVGLKEVIASDAFKNAHSSLTVALGKDIAGHSVVVDLAKMPHLLVAGTTGSGKSVSLNAMLLSLLYKSTPEQLRLILIDPKMLELAVYDAIPHLLVPVVTDMKNAASALRWCVMEMERRYKLMASLGVRNITGYNTKVKEAAEQGKPLPDPFSPRDEKGELRYLEALPKIVVLADEFADMMHVVGKQVETLIARIAQKARAAGIHLILATQRPSVDVITGLIKANIPTRMAFQVSSKIDSRTILDQQGAEQLLGHGDMLYLAPGAGVPVRVHGAFVSDEEVHRVVSYLKSMAEPNYLEEILDEDLSKSVDSHGFIDPSGDGGDGADVEKDTLYDEAVDLVARTRRVSISSIQRRFKIGYNRAARMVDAMEAAGIVTAMETNGNREVLVPAPQE